MWDRLGELVRSVRAHATRMVLTSLGVAWGAMLLTFLSGQMGALRGHYIAEVEEAGPKLIFMGAGVVLKNKVGERGSRVIELAARDVDRIEQFQSVEHTTPSVETWNATVRYGRQTRLLSVIGYDSDAAEIRNLRPAQGRFISKLDVARGSRVAFLGSEAKRRLFGDRPPLGEQIHLASIPFRVVGVGVPKGEQLVDIGNPDDQLIVVPYTAAMRWLQQSTRVESFLATPVQIGTGALAITQARGVTSIHKHFDQRQETALWASDLWDTVQLVYGMFYALQGFFIVAGVVTSLVGAVGVMNIMLVVVGERTSEIGLRKALGARSRDIFAQVLLEALVVAGIAAATGILAGLALLRVTASLFAQAGISATSTPDALTLGAICLSLLAVAATAGLAPALRAARIPPAEALRAY